MINYELVKDKLAEIEQYYTTLQPLLAMAARELIEDVHKLRSMERHFQLIVDTALDVNAHIITEMNLPMPDDYQNTFEVLGRHKVMPLEFALRVAPSVGLRNRVVHKYGKVDVKRMVDEVKDGIPQYLEYLKYINDYLQKNEA